MPSPKQPYGEAVLDLLWSLWGEMGLRSVIRNHPAVVVDPEPILLLTSWFAPEDPRLEEEVLRWCASHATWLSTARLRQLYDTIDGAWQARFATLATAVHSKHKHLHWPGSQGSQGIAPQGSSKEVGQKKADRLPFQHPSMLRFRLRALVGVGARADVLTHFLAAPSDSHNLGDFFYLHYTKSTLVPLLRELSQAGQLDRWKVQKSYRYRLRQPQLWAQLLQNGSVHLLDCMALARVLRQLDNMSLIAEKTPRVAQVEASTLWNTVQDDLRTLGQSSIAGPLDLPALQEHANALVTNWSTQGFAARTQAMTGEPATSPGG